MIVDRSLPLASGPLRKRLEDAMEVINLLVERMRSLSLELRPQVLDDLGLLVALEWHFKHYLQQTSIQVEFRHTPLPGRLPALLESALFRIAQEALTNVARHARVREVAVRLWVDEERVGLQVADEGAGFDAEAALAARVSSGLSGMRERALLLGGEFTLESQPGKGTRLTVELPVAGGGAGGAASNGGGGA
jgi:signal transduction histidine kinase